MHPNNQPIGTKSFNNLSSEALVEMAIARKEGVRSANGALATTTGTRTGRSAKDRFIVKDAITAETVHWGTVNQPIAPDIFQHLWDNARQYLGAREVFTAHLQVGADTNYAIPVTVISETAWHNLFAKNLFITPTKPSNVFNPSWTILCCPHLKTDPDRDGTNSDAAVILNFTERAVLVLGTAYAGEIKKAMFSVMNFLMPTHDILPMHCAANMGSEGDVTLLFGLSGTGKTTLSADPDRYLIGDDEHGWSNDGVFNFEGGCYAKCIDLSHDKEPVIWEAIRAGAIMENVVMDPTTLIPDYSSDKLTQNTRAAYPRQHIPLRVEANRGGHPNAVIFLTCDLFGVLPPVALLNPNQAAYYFLSGYTALVGSTEMGHGSGIKTTFSTCFGAPFFPRPAQVYAELLIAKLQKIQCPVYLVNTGWTGGAYGQGGKRFAIPVTRTIVRAIQSGTIPHQELQTIPGFNFLIPKHIPGIDDTLLNPVNTWPSLTKYKEVSQNLMNQFHENFKRFDVEDFIIQAGPQSTVAQT